MGGAFIHMIGDKITYSRGNNHLKVLIRASSRGDKLPNERLLSNIRMLLILGVLLIPIVLISLNTSYQNWVLSGAAFWLVLFLRKLTIYKYKKNGLEQITVTPGMLRYTSILQILGLQIAIDSKRISLNHHIDIQINPKTEALYSFQGAEIDMNKVVTFSDMGKSHVMKLRIDPKFGEELRELLMDYIRTNQNRKD